MHFAKLRHAMIDGGLQTAVVMLLVAASVLMGRFLTDLSGAAGTGAWLTSITDNKWVILLILNFFFPGDRLLPAFVAAAIILVVPIVMPLIAQVGIDPVHFGLVVTLNLAIGQQTPPVASVLITSCAVARAEYLGGLEGEHLLHRGAADRAADVHLHPFDPAVPGGVFLPILNDTHGSWT